MSKGPIPLSRMASGVQPSATLAAGALARQLKAQGKTVHDFSLGEPDFPTPEHICTSAPPPSRR
jgi:aspartate aminotransferase